MPVRDPIGLLRHWELRGEGWAGGGALGHISLKTVKAVGSKDIT